jgi:N-acetylmuramic acid 6-phosphate etherase
MKAGTAQKMILNRLSTAVMIRIGRVQGNRMVNMQLSNEKLTDRGTRMIVDRTGLSYEEAKKLLLEKKSVKKVLEEWHPGSEHFPSADHL